MATELESDVSLSPGQVAALIESLALRPSAGSPLAAGSGAAAPAPPPAEARLEAAVTILRAAADCVAPPVFSRGRRARPNYRGWLFGAAADPDEAALLLREENGAVDLYFGVTHDDLVHWLLQPYAGFQIPEIDLPVLETVPAATMTVLLALADLFRTRYPDPEPDWAPDGDFRFDVAELATLVPPADPLHSLRTAWAAVGGPELPLLDDQALDTELTILSLWAWLGKGEVLEAIDEDALTAADQPDSYWIAPALLWWVRCLAWWNHLLAVGPRGAGVAAIQATALWTIEPVDENAELRLQPITPAGLHHAVSEAIAAAWPTAVPAGPACPHCGVGIEADARFCPACGQPVQPNRCPRCGGDVRPGARFCAQCGQSMGD
jgi:hypothetical protein